MESRHTTEEAAMRLYEFAPTRSIRVRWTLQELGVEFEAVSVDLTRGEHRSPEFLKLNPAGKLPVLVDGERVLTESVAIVLYLAEKHPEKGLLPTDPWERAQLHRWLFFTVTELEQPLWRITRHTQIYPEAERLPGDIAIARREFREMAAVLEAHLRGRRFVVGERVSVGDFVLAYTLDWGSIVGLLDDSPVLRDYMERMYQRPKAALRIEEAFRRIQPAA
jgi:glutathione S-transferase